MRMMQWSWIWLRSKWRSVWAVWDLHALHPAHQIRPDPAGAYISDGEDPQFRFKEKLAAGWYWLELGIELPTARTVARVYIDMGSGESEQQSFPLSLKSGRIGRRLLRFPNAARVRLDPLSNSGTFRIEHFRLKKIRSTVARQRMQRKLINMHPRYRARQPGVPASAAVPEDLERLWDEYQRLYLRSGTELVFYQEWIDSVEREQHQKLAAAAMLTQKEGWREEGHWPVLSVIVPVYNTPASLLRACIESVLSQSYPNWELCMVDDASSESEPYAIMCEYAARDVRIKVCQREENGHIARASNTALNLATGEFVALLDHDDELAPHALFAVALAIQNRPSVQMAYSDEDKLNQDGHRCDPYFKPGFSPELLLSQNYFSHLGVYRRSLMQSVGGFRPGFEGSQDYDLVLRCMAKISDYSDIVHIPQVLYHWRMVEGSTAIAQSQKTYAHEAALRALQEHVSNVAVGAAVSSIAPGLYRQYWPIPSPEPLISLIIPTRDGYQVLRTCIESILSQTAYKNFEMIVVDNQSTCKETLSYLEGLSRTESRVRVLKYDLPFNYSAINNFAVQRAQGDVIALINNDVEVINSSWLSEMVSLAMRPEVGCVGAKLYYPDGTLQHGGVILGIGGIAGHAFQYFPKDEPGYFSRLRVVHNVSAVTGATLVVRRQIYEEVGGLNESRLPVAFNDVDFCLRVYAAGYRNVWTPFAELYHHESKSRGADNTPEKQARFNAECEYMHERWGEQLGMDPFYNQNLSLQREDYSICLRGY